MKFFSIVPRAKTSKRSQPTGTVDKEKLIKKALSRAGFF
jgi:hypothetical protein